MIDINQIDIVVPVPDTSKPVTLEISKQLNNRIMKLLLKIDMLIERLIMNTQDKRKKNIKRKLNVIDHLVKDKNILIIDDSIVRGNTIKYIIESFKEHNVKNIFVGKSIY